MDNWFEDVGKPTIIEALAAACGEVSTKFNDTLAAHNKASSDELDVLRNRVGLVDSLQHENALLRQQLSAFKEQSPSRSGSPAKRPLHNARDGSLGPHTPSVRAPLAPRSTNQALSISRSSAKPLPQKLALVDISNTSLSELRIEYSKLHEQYHKLYEKITRVEDARLQLETMYREKSKAVSEWKSHAKGLEAQSLERLQKIKALRVKLGTPSGTPQPGESRQSTNGLEDNTPNASNLAFVVPTATATTDNLIGSGDDTNSSNSELAGPASPKRNEAQREQNRTIPDVAVKREPEEVELPPMPTATNSAPTNIVQVKSEPSSDPIVVSEKVLRKRKADDEDNSEAPSRARIKTEPCSDPVSIGDSDKFIAHESMDLDADGQRVKTPRKIRRHQIQIPTMEQDDRAADGDTIVQEVEIDEPNVDEEQYIDLQPIGSDKPPKYTSPISAIGDRFRYRKSHSRPRGIASLAEDGEPYDGERHQDSPAHGKRTGPLNDLLNSSTPNRESIILPGGAQINRAVVQTPQGQEITPKTYHFPIPEKRPLPFGAINTPKTVQNRQVATKDTNDSSAQSPSLKKSTKAKTTRPTAVRGERLRDRPMSQLKLSDFKVNPAANEGIEFAFTDIVRSRDERSRLPGDLSVHAEEFRAQARAQRHQTSNHAFTTLLENWLGDQAWKLASMPTSEKEKHWEDAKMADLAKQCGRVKHRYQRQRTPPGAWRTDFPSTQEEEAYRAEAQKRDRETVSARYREAMRPGGLYIFRDE